MTGIFTEKFKNWICLDGKDDYKSKVKSKVVVSQAPAKPVLVYDGDCRFCETWIRRWREHTGGQVEYVPFQNATVRERFPEVNAADYEQAVHFIDLDGAVYRGAEAAYRSWAVAR